ncbi:MAG: DMT family transporter [Vicingaceae bacterium]
MNNRLKGVLSIAIGAASYGVLATFVQLANNLGFGTAGLTFAQYLFGAVVLTVMAFFKRSKERVQGTPKEKFKLMLFGTNLGLTSSFYYLSIQYVPVSVGIILLMQSIWMGVILEYFVNRELVNRTKVVGALIAVLGTIFAAKLLESNIEVNFTGIGFGLLAALSFTTTMYATNRVALELPNIVRSKYLIYGAFLIVVLFWNFQIIETFNLELFLKWGLFLGFFGTILPPILFNKGFPIVGTGLGGIIAAMEIPVSVFSAYLILDERISALQWVGILIILLAVVLINWKQLKRNKVNNK